MLPFLDMGRCDNADPAADFELLPVRPSRRTFEAAFPALSPVASFFAMPLIPTGSPSQDIMIVHR